MWSNFFTSGFRVLLRQKYYAFLNLAGLTIGIVAFVFIYLYIQNELYYDRSWKNYHQIYRVNEEYSTGGKVEKMALTPFLLADKLDSLFPEIIQSTRLFFTDPSDKNAVSSVEYKNERYDIPNMTIGDARVFKIFDYPFTEGDPDTCLMHPNSLVLSTAMKDEIFGSAPALGKRVTTSVREYIVTGVFDNTNQPSHLNFDAVISVNSLNKDEIQGLRDNWFWINCYTYLRLSDTVKPKALEQRMNTFVDTSIKSYIQKEKLQIVGYAKVYLQPIRQIHFSSGWLYDSHTNTNTTYLYIIGIVAIFILFTASINYINFATARSLKRAREIGVRKVLGAFRKQLVLQFVSEAIILTFTAFVLALSLVELMMPTFNQLVGKNINLVDSLFRGYGLFFGFLLLLLMILLAVVSGSFPAFVLSSLPPAGVLRGNNLFLKYRGKQRFTASGLRRLLVIIQYLVAIGMFISTLVMAAQIHFVENQPMGFNKDNVLVVNRPPDTSFRSRTTAFVTALKNDTAILGVTTAANMPGYLSGKLLFNVGDTTLHHSKSMSAFFIGDNYFHLLDIPLVEGRYFSNPYKADSTEELIVNEAAVKLLKLKHPLGFALNSPFTKKGKIIGVVKNFNFTSLHQKVEPLVFIYRPHAVQYIVLRINPTQKQQALKHLKKTWKAFNPGYSLHDTFLNEKLDSLYQSDQKILSLFIYFTIFVLLISSLGLYGLSAFLVEQRSKEISIRKVLGGSDNKIILLMVKEHMILVLLAGLLIVPVVYIFLRRWLNGFAYHIDLHPWFFVAGIVMVAIIAFFTVLIQSVQIVRKSPSSSLKYE